MKLSPFLWASSVLVASGAHAGAWSGGGGELIKDANNPWFLENTKTVRYCVIVDENNMSASRTKIESIVKEAIEYWKKDFKEAYTFKMSYNEQWLPLKVATQNFVKVECTQNTDLRFQFGVLSAEQSRFLITPTKYLGVAIRTQYDPVSLKGKGFIYISPDKGPLRYEDADDLIKDPWSYDGLLHKTLVHELGHVFGLPHSNREREVMGQTYPESILDKTSTEMRQNADIKQIPSYLNVRLAEGKRAQMCWEESFRGPVIRFFGVPIYHNCFEAIYQNKSMNVRSGLVKENENGVPNEIVWENLGTAQITKRDFSDDVYAVMLVLNKDQKVLPVPYTAEWKKIPMVAQRFEVLKANYTNQITGQARPIALKASVYNYLSIAGMVNNEVFVDLPYDSGETAP